MYSFTLNHTLTSQSLGVRLTSPLSIPVSTRRVEDIEVPGRAGTLTRISGWEDTVITLDLAVSLEKGLAAYRHLAVALQEAKTISVSGEPGRFRIVKHVRLSPLERRLSSWGMCRAEIVCQPFNYHTQGLTPLTVRSTQKLTNPGSLPSDPVITVYGTGTGSFTINGRSYRVTVASGQVTLDSARLVAHVAGRVAADALTGPFPTLDPGANQISLGSGVNRLDVIGNWKDL